MEADVSSESSISKTLAPKCLILAPSDSGGYPLPVSISPHYINIFIDGDFRRREEKWDEGDCGSVVVVAEVMSWWCCMCLLMFEDEIYKVGGKR